MGSYLNPSSWLFQRSLNSEIYVDKSELIARINRLINTQQCCLCLSRPRRFGKSMAADMLAAYYTRGEDTHALFDGLKIAGDPSYPEHLNRYNVIKVNMQNFLSSTESVEDMLAKLTRYLIAELLHENSGVPFLDREDLVQVMLDITAATGCRFVILIDEWDCLFREFKDNHEEQKKYLDFLRRWLKDQPYVALTYMTGILPVKKYGTHSALNMFTEYSMTEPRELAEYFGFTDNEVRALCDRYQMSFEEAQAWYDGYELTHYEAGRFRTDFMYSPRSVVESMRSHRYSTYWNQTETYEALKIYIRLNYDGLKDAIVRMLAGESIPVNTGTFTNDMTTFTGRDDVLTLLVHLGYLTYNAREKTVSIPNKEVAQEYINAIGTMESWSEVARGLKASRELLEALWERNGSAVAAGLDRAHEEISILRYNDENSLSCAIHLAFWFAREYYTVIRELPTGKGFADIVLIPRKLYADKPAIVIELKKDRTAEGAIAQIREKNYPASLTEYKGNLLLCGINYGKDKKHTCVIENLRI